ncbi:MAG: hypothetical protein ACD_75C00085G0001, partial [uncultured bacterium]
MALGHHRYVGNRQLQRATALLPGDQSGHRSVDLAGQKTLGTDRHQPQHVMQGRNNGKVRRQGEGLGDKGFSLVGKGLLRDLTQQHRQLDIDRRGIILIIVQDKAQVAGHLAQHLAGHLLAGTDLLEFFDIFRADQKAVAFLVFRHIDLQDRHGRVADPDVADRNPAAGFFHQFLEHIGRPTRALVVDHVDQGLVAHLVA